MIEQLQTTTHIHRLSLHTVLAELWAPVDAGRIEQALSDLLANAIKYSPRSGFIEVMLEEDPERHEVCFCIHDQGMGIPRGQQAQIFERFVRGGERAVRWH